MPIKNIMHMTLEMWGAIFMAVCIIIILAGRKSEPKRSTLMSFLMAEVAVLLVSDSVAWGLRGHMGMLGYIGVRLSNFLVFLMIPVLFLTMVAYVRALINAKGAKVHPKTRTISLILGLIDMAFIIWSQFTKYVYYFDSSNYYHRSEGFLVCTVFGFLFMLILFGIAIQYRQYLEKKELLAIISYFVFPLISNTIQALHYGLSLNNLAITISVLLLFITHESEKAKRLVKSDTLLMEQEVALAKQQAELTKKDMELLGLNMSIMKSQIGPHFLYNSLATISYLCDYNPKLAKEAVDHFAGYLRMNLDSLNGQRELVPFKKELEHIKTYLWLEKLRFGDELNVEYDVQFDDFMVPPLSIQPIVENAVKHGVCMDEEGGTVCIKTELKNDCIIVSILDDGVGFDMKSLFTQEAQKLGIQNVERRLEQLCNGTIQIQSELEQGTKCVITIPCENNEN